MDDFHDKDFLKFCTTNFETIRQRRNSFKGRPDDYERIEIELDRMFATFYKRVITRN